MTQKKTIAVIDSGIDRTDQLLKDIQIEELYFENGQLKQHYEGRINAHGTEIIKVLLREEPNLKIISVRTLNEDNKCLLSDIINAIKYCIDINVDIINLSLGSCSATAKRIELLRRVCAEAEEKGIVIFAADHNISNMKSYPANFDHVIGVTTSDALHDICNIRYKDRIVEFSDNTVYIPDNSRCTIRRGNSYLCPLLVGLFCSFTGDRKINDSAIRKFMDFLGDFSLNQNASKVFFNKYEANESYALQDKKMLFFTDDMDINNMRLYGMYNAVSKVELCFDNIVGKPLKEAEKCIKDTDVFFFGAMSNQFINENREYLADLIDILRKYEKTVITVFPITSTYKRICLTAENNFQIRSIYK